jgi:WD40 repeat protein
MFSPDGQRVVTTSSDQTVRVWNASTGQMMTKLESHPNDILSVVFWPGGLRLVTVSPGGAAQVWNADSNQVIAKLEKDNRLEFVNSAAFSPDGQRVATGTQTGYRSGLYVEATRRILDGSLGAVDVPTGEAAEETRSQSITSAAAFSPDGQRVVTTSELGVGDGTVLITNATTGQVITKLEIRPNSIGGGYGIYGGGAGYGGYGGGGYPSGQRAVAQIRDDSVRAWNAATGQMIAKLEGHSGFVKGAAFSPDGQRVVTANSDHAAQIFRIVTLDDIARLLASK